jgi:hypothetical protein
MRRTNMIYDKEVKKPGDVEEEPKVQNELSDADLERVAGAGGACADGKGLLPPTAKVPN